MKFRRSKRAIDHAKTPGTAPGSNIYVGSRHEVPFHIDQIIFNENCFERNSLSQLPLNQIGELDFDADAKTWLHISGMHDSAKIAATGEALNLHPLLVEDILNSRHRPKVEFFSKHFVVILKILVKEGDTIITENLTIVATENAVITFGDCKIEVFSPVLKRIKHAKGRIRHFPSDYLVWAIIDTIFDHYLLLTESFEEEVASLDETVQVSVEKIDSHILFQLRNEVNVLFRTIRPAREIIHQLQRSEMDYLTEKSAPFYADLYDHIVNALENIEHLREQTSSLRDFYLASVSNRMNEIMKVLTCFSAIFLPLTFVAGVYGMNFKNMPELQWSFGYAFSWLLFIGSTIGMLLFFKKKGWM